ncbi:MAG TPA: RNA polymerase sigma factor, partial [Solirubrobacteraceae bacterium]|nr:RNA polymerase sigma factor [Solirubrobacteraceae bacterium]
AGDADAFEALYDRHAAPLLAFCRHMLGNREDGEDALQQTFVRAHRALAGGRAPDRVRPWLYAIARNRCLTVLAARREAALPAEDLEPAFDGLAADVERRAELRELLADLARLPDDQREALVLAELGDLGHPDIARVLGCPPAKVKALVFQARTALIAERDARRTPCDEIRVVLETASGGALRRGSLRRHLRQCDPCAAFRAAMDRQRAGLAILLPVIPSAGLKAAVLGGAGGLGAGAETAGAAAALATGGAGTAASAGGGVLAMSGAASAGAVKALVVKAAVVAALAAGGGEAVRELARDEPSASAASAAVADVAAGGARGAAPGAGSVAAGGAAEAVGRSGAEEGAGGGPREEPAADAGAGAAPDAAGRPRVRRIVAAAIAGDPAAARRIRRRLRAADPDVARRVRRRLIRAAQRTGSAPTVGVVLQTRQERRRARRRDDPAVAPEPVGEEDDAAATEPVATATPEPRPRRRRRPRPAPTPAPSPAPAPAPTTEPAPTAEPAPTVETAPPEEPVSTPEPELSDESDATVQPG